MNVNIPNNIKEVRESMNFTRKQLSKKMGITPTRVHQWESGIAMPGLVNVFKLCLVLGVVAEDLYKNLFVEVKARFENQQDMSDLLRLRVSEDIKII
jgi:transcriptional regulator with XRE-family HTH domain